LQLFYFKVFAAIAVTIIAFAFVIIDIRAASAVRWHPFDHHHFIPHHSLLVLINSSTVIATA